jgi:hypothetical protein
LQLERERERAFSAAHERERLIESERILDIEKVRISQDKADISSKRSIKSFQNFLKLS